MAGFIGSLTPLAAFAGVRPLSMTRSMIPARTPYVRKNDVGGALAGELGDLFLHFPWLNASHFSRAPLWFDLGPAVGVERGDL